MDISQEQIGELEGILDRAFPLLDAAVNEKNAEKAREAAVLYKLAGDALRSWGEVSWFEGLKLGEEGDALVIKQQLLEVAIAERASVSLADRYEMGEEPKEADKLTTEEYLRGNINTLGKGYFYTEFITNPANRLVRHGNEESVVNVLRDVRNAYSSLEHLDNLLTFEFGWRKLDSAQAKGGKYTPRDDAYNAHIRVSEKQLDIDGINHDTVAIELVFDYARGESEKMNFVTIARIVDFPAASRLGFEYRAPSHHDVERLKDSAFNSTSGYVTLYYPKDLDQKLIIKELVANLRKYDMAIKNPARK